MPPSRPVLRLFLLSGPRGGLERLRASFADITPTPLGLEIPLEDRAPEEILSLLLRFGVTARATRIVDRPRSG
ncbi:MAG TPA: hypothetical protein VIQ98_10775 [Gemmatimonadales bacterium]|jgi:hypothetical protein